MSPLPLPSSAPYRDGCVARPKPSTLEPDAKVRHSYRGGTGEKRRSQQQPEGRASSGPETAGLEKRAYLGALPGTGVRDAGAAAEPAQAWSLLDAAPREVQPALRPWHRSRHWLLPGPGPGVTSPQGSSVLLRLHLPARAGRPGSGLRIQKGLRRQRRGDSRGFRRERGVGHLVNTHLHCRGTRRGRHHDVPSCRRRRREQGWVSRPPAGHQGPGKLCPWRTGESNALAVKPKSPRRVSARALSGEAGARPRKRRSCVRAIQPRTRFAPRN